MWEREVGIPPEQSLETAKAIKVSLLPSLPRPYLGEGSGDTPGTVARNRKSNKSKWHVAACSKKCDKG